MTIRQGFEITKAKRLIAALEERVEALEARVEVLEQKRGPGRPKKETHKVNGTDA